jgi:D-galactarolactone cycloisomerase
VKIREIRAAGMKGATPQGGWSRELEQADCIHTLIVVATDEGVTGVGSVFTNGKLKL